MKNNSVMTTNTIGLLGSVINILSCIAVLLVLSIGFIIGLCEFGVGAFLTGVALLGLVLLWVAISALRRLKSVIIKDILW